MGSVDPSDVHPLSHQVAYQLVVVGCLGGQGNHDPDHPSVRPRSEQGVGIPIEGDTALLEALRGCTRWDRAMIQRGPDAPDRGEHVGFAPSERGQAVLAKEVLQGAQIGLAQREVVNQVDCILAVLLADCGDVGVVVVLHPIDPILELGQTSADGGKFRIRVTRRSPVGLSPPHGQLIPSDDRHRAAHERAPLASRSP
jgi:hypothetical protein